MAGERAAPGRRRRLPTPEGHPLPTVTWIRRPHPTSPTSPTSPSRHSSQYRLQNHRPPGGRRSRVTALFAAAVLPAALFAAAPSAAANAPGNPGTPAAPTVLYDENFENGQGAVPVLLSGYTGAAPTDETYTGAPTWVDAAACNGYLASEQDSSAPAGSGCGGTWGEVQRIAGALGSWDGADPATNHALVSYTGNDPGAGVEFQTVTPIALPSAGRFLTVESDDAGMNCYGTHPLYDYALLDGTTAIPTTSAPVDPCAQPDAVINGVNVGTYTGDIATLYPDSSVGVQLINEQPSGYGNDAGVDNIRVVDVSPQLDLSGTAGAVPVGAAADLAFTVTNTAELDAKNGWAFTANLPAGLTTADGIVTSTCGAATATPNAAGTSIAISGGLAAGQTSCAVIVHVTSILGGSYKICAAQITSLVGIDPPGCTTLTFTGPVFDARADSARLSSPLLNLGPLAPSNHECTSAPGTDGNGLAAAGLGAVGNLGLLTTSASGTIAADGTRTANATARTAGLSLLGGLITADAVNTTAQARQALTPSGPGTVTTSGGTVFTNLRVAGVLIAVNVAPNTTIALPLVGSVVLNEQKTIAGGSGITVNALDVTLLVGTKLTISTSTAALLTATQTCPVA